MNIRIFELERVQSIYENSVDYNLTESGFHPYKLNEILTRDQLIEIENTVLGYGQTNGSIELRQKIASYHKNCTQDNVLVTNGSAEANFIACHILLERGDEVVMMVPNYMQIQGIAEEMGCTVKFFHLREENNWAPDIEELKEIVTQKTKMIVLCNPDNPTGYTLTENEMKIIVEIAKENDSWIYVDEVYRGAELNNIETSSFYGYYDKVIVNGGLSKAYALPGLRLGWLVGPIDLINDSWAYHDYTTLTAGILSHKIGEIVLEPDVKSKIIERNRNMLRENLKVCMDWIKKHEDLFHLIPPKAGGMAFVRYNFDINSSLLAERLRKEKSVFILAGDTYYMDKYFRIGIGAPKEYLSKGLNLISDFLMEL